MRQLALAFVALIVASTTAYAATIHIVAFGDSATDGWLVARKDAYPAQLERVLRRRPAAPVPLSQILRDAPSRRSLRELLRTRNRKAIQHFPRAEERLKGASRST